MQMCLADTSVPELLGGLIVPRLATKGELYLGISILGAVVMPHNLYLHSALVLSRKINGSEGAIRGALMYNKVESAFALGVSLFINVAVSLKSSVVPCSSLKSCFFRSRRLTYLSVPHYTKRIRRL